MERRDRIVSIDLGAKDLSPKDLIGPERNKARLALSKYFRDNFGKSFPLYQIYFLNFRGLSLEISTINYHEYTIPEVFTFSNSGATKGSDFLAVKMGEKTREELITQKYRDKNFSFSLFTKTIFLKSLEDVSNKNIPLQNFAHQEMETNSKIPNLLGCLHERFLEDRNMSFNIKKLEEIVALEAQKSLIKRAA